MPPEQILQSIRNRPYGRLLLHSVMWLFYGAAIWYLQSISFNPFENIWVFASAVRQTLLAVFVFYALVYFAWPFLLLRRKYFAFAGAVIVMIIIYCIVDSFTDQWIFAHCDACLSRLKNNQRNYYNLLQRGAWQVIFVRLISLGIVYEIFVTLTLPLTIKVLVEYFTARITTLELQRENIKLELIFLKSQVNPHFLFNTLNNIYALILKDKKDESAETVARLSTFLRYSLYETDADLNPAEKEIDLLKSYVALEKIRLNDTVVNFTVTTDYGNYMLPPLLFIPAVENAFKFCAPAANGDAYIFIYLSIEKDLLSFRISNSCESRIIESPNGGIGLVNLQKRLARYFPGERHNLSISREAELFQMEISIKLVP